MSDLRLNEGPPQEDPYDDATLTRSISPWNPNTVRGEPATTTVRTESLATVAPTDREAKAQVDSLDQLQADRRALLPTLKPLEYIFGSGRDNEAAVRRRHREGIGKLILREMEEAAKAEKKDFKAPSEAALERMANTDERHESFCKTLEAKFNQWYDLRNQLMEIEEKIESRKIELLSYNAETRL